MTEMTNSIEQYLPFAKLLFEGKRNYNHIIEVTYDKIDCDLHIQFMKQQDVIDLTIRTTRCGLFLNNLSSFTFCNHIETIDQMAASLQYLFNRLNAIKFNHCIGKFESIIEIENRTAIELAVGDHKRQHNECCVCNTITVTKTHCGHTLCVLCHDKLKLPNCPMCRTSLQHDDGMETDGNSDVDE